MKFKYQALVAIFAFAQVAAQAQPAQGTPGSGWSMDPSKQGMRDLRSVRPIEGCMAPGGLQRIISSDEPGSGAFWCGTPPYCLTQAAVPGNWHCTIVQYSRRDPRGDPNGRPGANPVRNPEDLRCVNTGNMPINGQCPLPPPPPPDEPGDPGDPPPPPPPDDDSLPKSCSGPVNFGPIHDGVLCRAYPGDRGEGWEAEIQGTVVGPAWALAEPWRFARVRVRCQNGAWRVLSIPACYAGSGG